MTLLGVGIGESDLFGAGIDADDPLEGEGLVGMTLCGVCREWWV